MRRARLVVMTRAPTPGRCKTRLIPALGPEGAALLHQAMLEDVLARLGRFPALDWTVLVTPEDGGVARLEALAPAPWTVSPQPEGDLTARLLHGLEDAPPDAPTVFFGSDAPLLDLETLALAVSALEPGSAFIAPCADGGYTAVGLYPSARALLEDIPWSTDEVCGATRARARATGVQLREFSLGEDVDTPEDLARLASSLAESPGVAPRTRLALEQLSERLPPSPRRP